LKELARERWLVCAMDSEPAVRRLRAIPHAVASFREYLAQLLAKQPLAIWLNLEAGERETERIGTRQSLRLRFRKAGEGVSVWFDEKARLLKAPSRRCSRRSKTAEKAPMQTLQLLAGRSANLQPRDAIIPIFCCPRTAITISPTCMAAVQQR